MKFRNFKIRYFNRHSISGYVQKLKFISTVKIFESQKPLDEKFKCLDKGKILELFAY